MKKLLLGLFVFGFSVLGISVNAATLELTSSNNGNTFEIVQGQTIRITIANPGDGGYTLNSPIYNSSILQLTNHQHVNSTSYMVSYINPMPVGNFGTDYWEFQALNSGSTKLEITASRSWDSSSTMNLFSATINVRLAGGVIDYGCSNGQVYSSTTGQYCYRDNTTNPIISGVSGPQSLNLNQTGTWTVNATSSNGSNLTYSVDWGDVVYGVNAQSYQSSQYQQSQSATFTHSYGMIGTYTPIFTVTSTNSIQCFTIPCPTNGGSARTSLSVVVGNSGIDYGCSLGQIYSSTTGLRCTVILPTTDYGCLPGNIFSYTTGQRCSTITTIDYGCVNGNLYSSTTGQFCNNANQSLFVLNQRTLRLTNPRMTGDDVKLIQQFLELTADGIYGRGTAYAVSGWQAEHGIAADGTVGPETRARMRL